MPPKNGSNQNANPSAKSGYKPNPHPFAYIVVQDPDTKKPILKRTVSAAVPDRILMTGNRRELEAFYAENLDKLNHTDRRYLHARIHTAELVDRLERKALKEIAEGKLPPQPEIQNTDGYTGINLRLPGFQTSGNGCWSCAMSLLLKSRGVEISQEEIRAYRPEYPAGEEKMSENRMQTSNLDTSSSPYENADLLLKLVPNSGMQNCTIRPLDVELQFRENNPPQMPENLSPEQQLQWQEEAFNRQEALNIQASEFYLKQARAYFVEKVRQGLLVDKSPVIVNCGGAHYVTITGISEDGTQLRYEDSYHSCESTTRYRSVDDMIDTYLAPGMYGMDLSWVRDLPVPEKEQAQQQEMLRDPGASAAINSSGELSVNATGDFVTLKTHPEPGLGQLRGQEVSDIVYMDQAEMGRTLNGKLVNSGEYKGKPLQLLATESTYLPRKLRLLKDPEILQELEAEEQPKSAEEARQQAQQKAVAEEVKRAEDPIIDEDGAKDDPTANTFDSYESGQKGQLLQKSPDTPTYISNLYSTAVVKHSSVKTEADRATDRKLNEANALADQRTKLEQQPETEQSVQQLKQIDKRLTQQFPHLDQYRSKQTRRLSLNDAELRRQLRLGAESEKKRINPTQEKVIGAMSGLAMPVVKEMLREEKGSEELEKTALEQSPNKLVEKIDSYADKKYYIEGNQRSEPGKPDWVEKRHAVTSALSVLEGTGTGKNFLGLSRRKNTEAYDKVLTTLKQYKKLLDDGRTPTGMQNKAVIQHCLNYVRGKMSLRSERGTGQIRFHHVMGVLQQIMPREQFRMLLREVNAKRQAVPGDKAYVDEYSFAPKTADRVAKRKTLEALNKTGPEFEKLCSEALAAKLIAARNPRGGKTLVEDAADPSLRRDLEKQAEALREDPAFRRVLESISGCATPKERRSRMQELADGAGLHKMYVNSLNAPEAAPVIRP